jgi:hypothetical protein
MVETKTFAWAEAILGLLVIIYPFVWCYILGESVEYLFAVEVALGALVLIVAALALMTRSTYEK